MKSHQSYTLAALTVAGVMLSCMANAQMAINDDGVPAHASAVLEVTSNGAGVLVPRMTNDQRNAIAAPATGLLIYNTDERSFHFYNGSAWFIVGDGDGDETNELQTLSRNGSTVTLSGNGGSISVVDGDADPSNERQALSRDGDLIRLQNGASASLVDGDGDPENELQTLSQSGSTVTLSNGGGSFAIPTGGDNDPTNELDAVWDEGTHVTYTGGNVGIGGQPDGVALDVYGQLRHRANSPVAGKVLATPTLNSNGEARWGNHEAIAIDVDEGGEVDEIGADSFFQGDLFYYINVKEGDRLLFLFSTLASFRGFGSGDDDIFLRFNVSLQEDVEFFRRATGNLGDFDQHRDEWVPISTHFVYNVQNTGRAQVAVDAKENDGNEVGTGDELYFKEHHFTVINLGKFNQ